MGEGFKLPRDFPSVGFSRFCGLTPRFLDFDLAHTKCIQVGFLGVVHSTACLVCQVASLPCRTGERKALREKALARSNMQLTQAGCTFEIVSI